MFFIVRGLRSDAWPSFRYKAVKIKGRTASSAALDGYRLKGFRNLCNVLSEITRCRARILSGERREPTVCRRKPVRRGPHR